MGEPVDHNNSPRSGDHPNAHMLHLLFLFRPLSDDECAEAIWVILTTSSVVSCDHAHTAQNAIGVHLAFGWAAGPAAKTWRPEPESEN